MIMEGTGGDDDDEGIANGKVGDETGIPAAAASFVSSMTFASGGAEPGGFGGGCDCDEGDCVRRRGSRGGANGEKESNDGEKEYGGTTTTSTQSFVPETIRKAIELHNQRKKRLRRTLPPTRTLLGRHYCVFRDDDDAVIDEKAASTSNQDAPVVSAWEWELPYRAEPSLEFGTSHRLVWVRRCPGMIRSIASSTASSIVVGSSEEEASRVPLEDWTEGSVAFVPSNGGHAVGYVHASGPSPTNPAKSPRGAAADRNPTDQDDEDDDDDDDDEWEQLNRNDEAPPGGLYATLLVVKLPDRLLVSDRQVTLLEQKDATSAPPTQQQSLPSWLAPLVPICQRLLLPQDDNPRSCGVGLDAMKPRYTILGNEDAHVVKAALSSLLRDEKASR